MSLSKRLLREHIFAHTILMGLIILKDVGNTGIGAAGRK